MRWIVLALMLMASPALAQPRIVKAIPAAGSETVIDDNAIEITFSEKLRDATARVTDAQSRQVSTGVIDISEDGKTVVVHMKAHENTGYICGPMNVFWKVKTARRQAQGSYGFKIRNHHGGVCAHKH